VGLAPIVPGESTTRIAVLDFDSHKGEVGWDDMRSLAGHVAGHLASFGYAPITFRSSGGHGIHILLLWEEPQDAYSVREMLTSTLAIMGLTNGTKGVKHREVEIFPKQDSVPSDGYGSMFVLAYAGESELLHTHDLHSLGKVAPTDWPKAQPVPVLDRPVYPSSTIDPASLPTSLAEVRSALAAIPNEGSESLEYDSWRTVIFALHHATQGSPEGLALAHDFSSRSSKYDPAFLDERVWPYIKTERGGSLITERSLFNTARAHGWLEDIASDFQNLDELAAGEGSNPTAETGTVHGPGAPAKPVANRFKFIPFHVFAERPAPEWIIQGVLPDTELALIVGQSGAGKSFLALDLAASIARGESWRGRRVRQGHVAYIAAEGAGGFRNRGVAYAQHHGVPWESLRISVLPDNPNLLQQNDVRQLILALRELGKIDVVMVDTLAQTMAGGDENSGEDMGKALGHCRAIHKHTGALVIPIHHLGKDEARGPRGWSGLTGAADAVIAVMRDNEKRSAVIAKMKDGVDGLEFPFKLQVLELGQDSAGETITSCVVEHLDESPRHSRREPKGNVERLVWRVVHNLVLLGEEAVTVSAVIEHAKSELAHDPAKSRDRRREIITRALQALAEGSFLRIEDGIVRVGQ
jgi:hypothetical protein